MASFRPMSGGKWRAEVYRRGKRESKVCSTKSAAKAWAARREYELDNPGEVASDTLFGDVMDRYAREVSSKKRGARSEIVRIERIRRDRLARIRLGDLRPADLADWRDRRLLEVKSATVKREMEQLSAVLTQCVKEWGLLSQNPMAKVRRAKDSPPRDRLPAPAEIEALRISAGDNLDNATARTFHAFLFACETAMRAGEIAGLEWGDVDLAGRVAHLSMTKNGTSRNVPLTLEAVRLLEALPSGLRPGAFGLTSPQITALFAKVRKRAGVVDLRFHDSRAEGTTRLSRKVDVLTLARITGHRDLRILQRYYREDASSIARRLD